MQWIVLVDGSLWQKGKISHKHLIAGGILAPMRYHADQQQVTASTLEANHLGNMTLQPLGVRQSSQL
jgi:hypothetical protein